MTEFHYFPLAQAHLAKGVTVVVDVLRAFTTAAYAFAAGATEIYPVSTVHEALNLSDELPNALTMGEVDALKPMEFNFGNSPAMISKQNLHGKILIQRTSAGTQGIVKAVNADRLLAASFVVCGATVAYLRRLSPQYISFIITGDSLGRDGDEDRACAEYIEALLCGRQPESEEYTERVKTSTVGQLFLDGHHPHLAQIDLEMSIHVDAFQFPLLVHHVNQRLVMRTDFTGFPSMESLKIE
ncbi:MAG: 2-phosphosulfolactate phosphatase [Anaerolineales bacterium]